MSHLLIRADARRIPLADGSVHCVVTSPPYWSLRDYDTARWEGGDPACDHRIWGHAPGKPTPGGRGGSMPKQEVVQRDLCRKCGARRVDSQLGLEPTPEAYVARMVEVFREIKRVLRDDGTLWLNLGDSYNTRAHGPTNPGFHSGPRGAAFQSEFAPGFVRCRELKNKDLVGIPWRVAFALQADGWYLRSDIIWAKPNPMPESVEDRPTKSHEYMFMLSKRERYFYDADAVRESARYGRRTWKDDHYKNGDIRIHHKGTTTGGDPSAGRNLRTVWTIATEAYPGAHFATFPRRLVRPCIEAGTSGRGVCPGCGAPWVRVVDREVAGKADVFCPKSQGHASRGTRSSGLHEPGWRKKAMASVEPTGWRPTCSHGLDPVPATVLDPFAGSGTTLVVAEALGRRAIGLDLSRPYLTLARRRITRPHARTPRPAPREPEHMPLFDRVLTPPCPSLESEGHHESATTTGGAGPPPATPDGGEDGLRGPPLADAREPRRGAAVPGALP